MYAELRPYLQLGLTGQAACWPDQRPSTAMIPHAQTSEDPTTIFPHALWFTIYSNLTIEQIWLTRLVSKGFHWCGYGSIKAKCVAQDAVIVSPSDT